MKISVLPIILFFAAILFSACARSNGTLTVTDARARPALKGENGAAYFIVSNATNNDDTLLGVSTDIASSAEVHMSMVDDNGVASMQMQEPFIVPAQQEIIFKPGDLHIMLVDLKQDLKIGDAFTLVLRFEKAGEITVSVEVMEQP